MGIVLKSILLVLLVLVGSVFANPACDTFHQAIKAKSETEITPGPEMPSWATPFKRSIESVYASAIEFVVGKLPPKGISFVDYNSVEEFRIATMEEGQSFGLPMDDPEKINILDQMNFVLSCYPKAKEQACLVYDQGLMRFRKYTKQVLQDIIALGYPLESICDNGNGNLLHAAANKSNVKAIEFLLDKGFDPTIRTQKKKLRAYDIAILNHSYEAVSLFEKRFSPKELRRPVLLSSSFRKAIKELLKLGFKDLEKRIEYTYFLMRKISDPAFLASQQLINSEVGINEFQKIIDLSDWEKLGPMTFNIGASVRAVGNHHHKNLTTSSASNITFSQHQNRGEPTDASVTISEIQTEFPKKSPAFPIFLSRPMKIKVRYELYASGGRHNRSFPRSDEWDTAEASFNVRSSYIVPQCNADDSNFCMTPWVCIGYQYNTIGGHPITIFQNGKAFPGEKRSTYCFDRSIGDVEIRYHNQASTGQVVGTGNVSSGESKAEIKIRHQQGNPINGRMVMGVNTIAQLFFPAGAYINQSRFNKFEAPGDFMTMIRNLNAKIHKNRIQEYYSNRWDYFYRQMLYAKILFEMATDMGLEQGQINYLRAFIDLMSSLAMKYLVPILEQEVQVWKQVLEDQSLEELNTLVLRTFENVLVGDTVNLADLAKILIAQGERSDLPEDIKKELHAIAIAVLSANDYHGEFRTELERIRDDFSKRHERWINEAQFRVNELAMYMSDDKVNE